MSRTAVVLLAAGSSKRMQGSVPDKILAPLGGRPVFAHSVAAFQMSGVGDYYVIVYRDAPQLHELMCYAPTPAYYVQGGKERQDSVALALEAIPPGIDYVFIHDCARPFIQAEQLVGLLKIVKREEAVVLAHRVTDTIKAHRGEGNLRTLDRSNLWAMETPQVFAYDLITRAYARIMARGAHVTDDAAAVEAIGHPVALLENTNPNPKLTTPSDLDYFEFLLSRRALPTD
ncbi:2-C-methyl-D-erythritol 4-phosphate cytidylyltransferase [mine drainage metagenome]|uniref:2-C-methyl-D-erythritol 4-phosphate cytidylyltransferase n=1 Tax=mine drainage metagenome TaxID=410659 RepID=A0A1J5TCM4_9ZZZZ